MKDFTADKFEVKFLPQQCLHKLIDTVYVSLINVSKDLLEIDQDDFRFGEILDSNDKVVLPRHLFHPIAKLSNKNLVLLPGQQAEFMKELNFFYHYDLEIGKFYQLELKYTPNENLINTKLRFQICD